MVLMLATPVVLADEGGTDFSDNYGRVEYMHE
jgi:hypothetical protein